MSTVIVNAPTQRQRRINRQNLPAWIAGGALVVIVLLALLAPWLAPHDPTATDIRARLQPPFWMNGGDTNHLLGTDSIGRDLLARILYGIRSSLFIGLAAVAIGGAVGVTAAILSGYYEGRISSFLFARLADVQQAIPFVVLALAIAAAVGASFRNLILILGLGSWVYYYRLVRADVLPLREEPFILAQRTIGSSTPRILLRHVLPNVMPSILVTVTLFVSTTIMYAAALSFLGLGIQPPEPSWGADLGKGRDFMELGIYQVLFPGLTIMVAVLGFNLLGDGLRDFFDPRSRKTN